MNKTIDIIRRKFHEGCATFDLLEDGDRVLLALSGGKDSLMMTQLMAEQSRIHHPRIDVAAAHVIMDNIPYETEQQYLTQFCAEQDLPIHIIHTSFDESTDTRKTKCFLCSWYRRKALFKYAVENGFNKIALGHHQDDMIITWLMNITYTGSIDLMQPMMKMHHYPLHIIRPLCLVHESWISEVGSELHFEHQKTPCPYETASRRSDINALFQEMQKLNPEARQSIWRAMMKAMNK